MSIARKLITIAALGLATSWAHAGGVNWSIGINLPPIGTVISNAPIYHPGHAVPYYDPAPAVIYRPVPVYRPAPVYYSPSPVVVYRPAPRYIGQHGYVDHRHGHHRNRGWDRDHRWEGPQHRNGGRRDRGWNDRDD